MAIHPAAEATIRAFVVSDRRDRLSLLASRERRRSALNLLNHFPHWDRRWVSPFTSLDDVVAAMRRAGAPDRCHIISDDPSLDGQEFELAHAVTSAEAASFASLICCDLGKVALFFDEIAAPRRRLLLKRETEQPSG